MTKQVDAEYAGPMEITCADCGKPVSFGPRCHRCAAEKRYAVGEKDAAILEMVDAGMSYRQIAEQLLITKARVGQRVKRARERSA